MEEPMIGIRYEVALETLDGTAQPFIQAREEERQKAEPCAAFIQYCTDRIKALQILRHNLRSTDEAVIARILDPNDLLIR